MVDDVVPKLNQLGIPESRIKVELFTPAEPARGADRSAASAGLADECRVTIMADGTEYRFSMDKQEETILDAGLRRGIDLPHSCKSGICATCRAKLIAGEVHMDAHYALEQDEIDRGFILTCQSHPLTDEVEIDFDQSD
jgi:ring-1,2-phenylacetyl-CoA epoxidase subunit PaaE